VSRRKGKGLRPPPTFFFSVQPRIFSRAGSDSEIRIPNSEFNGLFLARDAPD
jgi:hypothetical protein